MSHSEAKIEETPADPYVAERISSDETVKSPKKKPGRKPKQKLVSSEVTQDEISKDSGEDFEMTKKPVPENR